jgi:hypothetical protein
LTYQIYPGRATLMVRTCSSIYHRYPVHPRKGAEVTLFEWKIICDAPEEGSTLDTAEIMRKRGKTFGCHASKIVGGPKLG